MIKRAISFITAILLLSFLFMPVFAAEFSLQKNTEISKPYEKVIAQNGNWYIEQVAVGESMELAISYDGSYESDENILFSYEATKMKIKDEMSLTGIYVPYYSAAPNVISITLTDDKGNIYGPFNMDAIPATAISVNNNYDKSLDTTLNNQMLYSFTPSQNIVLPAGNYSMSISDPSFQVRNEQTGPEGAYILKGIYAPAYEKYLKELKTKEGDKTSEENIIGNPFEENPYGEAEKPPTPKAAYFTLESDATVDEVMINTINNGAGAAPGTIGIINGAGEIVYSDQAYGVTLADVPNGMWAIAPQIVLPAGTYQIGLSDPAAITYDKRGEPLFYVNVSEPKLYRYDYTGTYKINLDTFKKTTLMGPVESPGSSFSLKDFELNIIDHGDYLELIGKYENMPFSQRAEIIDITDESVTANFDFSADLSNMPAKTKIGAVAQILLSKKGKDPAQLYLSGQGTYERAASKDKGADYNTYEVVANGVMESESLAPYVAAAIGAATAAGAVPGPGSPIQAATGLLFPPLVGLVVHIIQEAIKKAAEKKKALEGPTKYSKEWYRQQHPGASEETLAWIMMGDALGNSDEPDADPESSSDSSDEETSDNSNDNSNENAEEDESQEDSYEEDQSADSSQEEIIPEDNKKPLTDRDFMSEEEKAELDSKSPEKNENQNQNNETTNDKPWADKPETLTLETGIDGKTSTYELDTNTGEYVNPLTGGVLDMERYEKVVKPNIAKDQAFMDEERRKIAAGETAQDKALEQMLKDQQKKADDQKWQDYKNKIMQKYGVKSEKEAEDIITAKNAVETERAAKWNMIGNVAAVGEVGATVTGAVADSAVDFMGDRLGVAGKVIRAGYKVTKAVASDVATSGSESNWNTVKGAIIKGSGDAASDFIKSNTIKGALTVGTETVGSYWQADKGKEWDSISEGFVGGVVKVGSGMLTDKFAGDGFGSDMSIGKPIKGYVQVTKTDGSKFITNMMTTKDARNMAMDKINDQIKQSATKIGSSLADSFVVKPYGTDNISKVVKNLPKK